MITFFQGVAAAVVLTLGVAAGVPGPSAGLKTLAETGWADDHAARYNGKAYDNTGGSPAMFTYVVETPWQPAAMALLGEGEFLAPHFSDIGGTIYIMVAPHLLVDGEVVHGGNVNKDHFIVIYPSGNAERFDYSDDIA